MKKIAVVILMVAMFACDKPEQLGSESKKQGKVGFDLTQKYPQHFSAFVGTG